MKKILFLICGILICVASFAQPAITSFSPASGAIGSSVTITGAGFNTTANQNVVFFGATQATVTTANATSLTVTVPFGATYEYLSVTNLTGNLTAYSAQPFIVTLAGSITFATKVDFTTGSEPNYVNIGDIDGDGMSDLVSTNRLSNSVSVLRNTSTSGTVSFATKVDFATGTNPYVLNIGDIDGDGKLDLAVANYTSSTVSVFRNTSTSGSISFAAKVDFATGGNPYAVVIGDIDGDGKPELAAVNRTSNTLSVFRNTSTSGTISFATKVDFATGTLPRNLSIGDVDGNGKTDLVVANYSSNSISVFRNTSTLGTISFAAKVDFTTGAGSAPYAVNMGDIDGDGKTDVAVTSESNSVVSVFRNTSTSGVVSFAARVDFATGSTPRAVSFGDIDGDGNLDLAVASDGISAVSVLRNTSTSGTISFATKVDFLAGANATFVSIGDIDGDGKPDLAAANRNDNSVSVIRQIEPAVIPIITTFSPASGAIGSSVTITGTGFNTTANQNIVFFGATQATVTTASATSLTVTVPLGATYEYISVTNLTNNLTAYSAQPFIVTLAGSISFATKVDFASGSEPNYVNIGDIDGDGMSDLVSTNRLSNSVSVLRNTSTSGTVSFATKVDFTTGTNPYVLSIGDIDGDGKLDLAVANYTSGTVSVFRNTSTSGSISFAAKVDFGTGGNPYAVVIGDIDGDGKPELAAVNRTSNTLSVFRNTSTSGTISFATKVDFATGTLPRNLSIGDIDGNGLSDLVVANYTSNSISVFRNTSTLGTISFAAKVDFTTGAGSAPYAVNMGDIDGDGKADVAVTSESNNLVSVFRNTSISGVVSFAARVDFATGSTPRSVSFGDIDGDGNLDLAVASDGISSISVLQNTSTSGTISFAAKVDFLAGANATFASIGDIDGDGKPDLATANRNGNSISVLRQIAPLGIIEALNNNAFSVYPNPFSTQTTLVGTDVLNDATFTVYNSVGQQVKQIQNINSQAVTFNRDDLPTGLYFVHLVQNDKVIAIKKLVIAD